MKMCLMCRSEIDDMAIRCPKCQGDSNYNYFIEVAASDIKKHTRPFMAFLASFLLFCIMIVAYSFYGFWGAAGTLVFGGAGVGYIYAGWDTIFVICANCGNKDNYKWEGGQLAPGKTADVVCKCGKRARLFIKG